MPRMKRLLLLGISAALLISVIPLADWAYFRDRRSFISPVYCAGEIPIRNDAYGDGRFLAPRRGKRKHKGLDICAPLKSEVRASKGGISRIKFQKAGMGKYVIIQHAGAYSTLYGHLHEYEVADGDRIRQGDVIGYVGKTGNARYNSMKPHLHFEIIKNGEHLDPFSQLNRI